MTHVIKSNKTLNNLDYEQVDIEYPSKADDLFDKVSIIESDDFVIINRYEQNYSNFQHWDGKSEASIEKEFIEKLQKLGIEYLPTVNDANKLVENLRLQIEKLNRKNLEQYTGRTKFTDQEWEKVYEHIMHVESEYEACAYSVMRVQKRHLNTSILIKEGSNKDRLMPVKIIDFDNLEYNFVQVINQFRYNKEGSKSTRYRYDVTILVNGLPMVQVELKKADRPDERMNELWNQYSRYTNDSFNDHNSLYRYLHIFVLSNGPFTYLTPNFALAKQSDIKSYVVWADVRNLHINDLYDFADNFLQPNKLLKVLFNYMVFIEKDNVRTYEDHLLLMRPYQIAAAERILQLAQFANFTKSSQTRSSGYIWHTTGSGKTLTSFKTASLLSKIGFIDKVLFVVDRSDLDHQTTMEYTKIDADSVIQTDSTSDLRNNLLSSDKQSIIITTIQKLNHLAKELDKEPKDLKTQKEDEKLRRQKYALIFDECHRSQFGEMQRNIHSQLENVIQFGFTGTPIFDENSDDGVTTASVFQNLLHVYHMGNAIADKKVLPIKVENRFVSKAENVDVSFNNEAVLTHPSRILKIVKDIVEEVYPVKSKISTQAEKYFNGIVAVDSIESARRYYEAFKIITSLQNDRLFKLRFTTVYSSQSDRENTKNPNKYFVDWKNITLSFIDQYKNVEGADLAKAKELANGIDDRLNLSASEYLKTVVIKDYNEMLEDINGKVGSYKLEGDGDKSWTANVGFNLKTCKLDILIVVDMFLTGFDAPTLNTIYLDKNLQHHNLIQALSRTNRIYSKGRVLKECGYAVLYRNLNQQVKDAFHLFVTSKDKKTIEVKPFKDQMVGYFDENYKWVDGYAIKVKAILKLNPLEWQKHSNYVPEEYKEDFKKFYENYCKHKRRFSSYVEFRDYERALRNLSLLDTLEVSKELIDSKLSSITNANDREAFFDLFELNDENQLIFNENGKAQIKWPLLSKAYEDLLKRFYNILANESKKEYIEKTQNVQNPNYGLLVFTEIDPSSEELGIDFFIKAIVDKLKLERKEYALDSSKVSIDISKLVEQILSDSCTHFSKAGLISKFVEDNIELIEKEDLLKVYDVFQKYLRELLIEDAKKMFKEQSLEAHKDKAWKFLDYCLKKRYVKESGTELGDLIVGVSKLSDRYSQRKNQLYLKFIEIIDKYIGIQLDN